MNVAQILHRGSGRIVIHHATAPMGEIVSLMRAENIGSVIIVWSDGSIAGLISEREIVA